tara:strand:+ start:84 stop:251 length:168 start_codon:yes stop_codon:yes gene_type:complete
MTWPSDKIIEEYIKSNVDDDVVLSADEITEALRLIKEGMTAEQISYLTKNIAEPT